MAGGVALNSVANGRILREAGVERLYVQPAAGDGGAAVGAALYGSRVLLSEPARFVMDHAYWGQAHNASVIHDAVVASGLPAVTTGSEEQLIDRVTDLLARDTWSGGSRAGSNGGRDRSATAASWPVPAART
jgi:carbamoyltransferase